MIKKYISDCHNDLLTYAYMASKNEEILKDFIDYCNNVYVNGCVKSGIFNFYFLPKEEMLEELNIKITEKNNKYIFDGNKNIFDIINISINIINKYTNIDLNNYILGIEGCTYIKDEEELKKLNELGISAIAPVWNDENKYGSGNRNIKQGLTKEGKTLINTAIDLNMIIDLSHANEKTFNNIITIVKEQKEKNPIVIASHSNAKKIRNHPRNLSDEQIIKLGKINGSIGIVGFKRFCLEQTNYNYTKETKEDKLKYIEYYLRHINYICSLIGVDKVMISSDDMYHAKDYDKDYLLTGVLNLYDKELIGYSKLYEFLKSHFSSDVIEQILYKNFIDIKEKVNAKKYSYRRDC